jgi:hypothetical protein
VEVRQVLGGRYRLEERLGEGGMAVVWKAFDLVLGRSVAVKVLSGKYATDEEFRESILAEAQAAARVSHPHLASVYDYGESLDRDGRSAPYVVMELLSGPTLTERLKSGPLSPRTGLRICAEIAGALAFAHANLLVHRDVKPANVMLTPVGSKLVDFGVAAVAGAPDGSPGQKIMGTPNYVAPERLLGGPVVPASDVYGLGLLIHRVLTGRLPWPAGSPTPATRSAPDPLPPIDGVPPEIGELYLRCVALEPADRPTARDAAVLLAAAAGVRQALGDGEDESVPIDASEPGPNTGTDPFAVLPAGAVVVDNADDGPRPAPAVGRRVGRAAPVVVAALATMVAAVLIVTHSGQSRVPAPFGAGPTSTTVPASAPVPGVSGSPVSVTPGGRTVPPLLPPPGTGPGGTGPGGPGATVVPPGGTTTTTSDPPPPPPPPTTPPDPPSGEATFGSPGGSTHAVCFGSTAWLETMSPAGGYFVQQGTPNTSPGPAAQVYVAFKSMAGPERWVITVWCQSGQPQHSVTGRSRGPNRTRRRSHRASR